MHTTTTWLDVIVAMFALVAAIWFGYTLGRSIEKAQRTSEWAELRHAEMVAQRISDERAARRADAPESAAVGRAAWDAQQREEQQAKARARLDEQFWAERAAERAAHLSDEARSIGLRGTPLSAQSDPDRDAQR